MPESAWKVTQRRICRLWGMEPCWRGEPGSDGREGQRTVALEVKRSKGRVPRGAWIEQARAQGAEEGLPWVLVVVGHNDRAPVAVVDHAWLLALYARGVGGAAGAESAA